MANRKVTILGSGSWGTALASTFADNDNQVVMWGRSKETADEINQKHTNTHYLGDALINDKVVATDDIKEALRDADIVLIVIPTTGIRSVAKQVSENFDLIKPTTIIGHATKGMEVDSFKRISQMIAEELPQYKEDNLFFIAGPSHAESVIKKAITLVSVASNNIENAKAVQVAISTKNFRSYTNSDIAGAELSGALKNVLAIAGGVIKQLDMADNTQAALVTRGLVEMKRFGLANGGYPETFDGLAGLGDLIVTAMSPNSRNFRAGMELAKGKNKEQIKEDMGMAIEGILTAKAVYQVASQQNINMPISTEVYRVLYENESVDKAIENLMNRNLVSEEEK